MVKVQERLLEGQRVIASPAISYPPVVDEEAEWIAGIVARQDRHSFSMLFERWAPKVKSHFISLGEHPGVAEDMAIDALVAVWRQAAEFQPEKAIFSVWLMTIIRNAADAARLRSVRRRRAV